MSVRVFVCPSVCFSVCVEENEKGKKTQKQTNKGTKKGLSSPYSYSNNISNIISNNINNNINNNKYHPLHQQASKNHKHNQNINNQNIIKCTRWGFQNQMKTKKRVKRKRVKQGMAPWTRAAAEQRSMAM